MRNVCLRAAIALAAACLACNRVELERRPEPAGPSVLLVTIDTLRADHVGAYGARGAATPTLDTLAAEGVRFETAIATSPLTLPSHASILTGLAPPRHGVRHNGIFHLDAEVETLAEAFTRAGYSTAAFVSAWVLANSFGLDQGFARYDDDLSPRRAVAGGYLERDAAQTTRAALEWLDANDRPFFLWVHYYDPHAEYAPPPPFAKRFPDRPYDGEIAHVDAELGRLLRALRESGRLDRTVVAVTADHGEALGEHGEATHSYALYDATLRVPLLVRGPGAPAGHVVGGVVSSVDVAPTLLALAGVSAPAGLDGRDLGRFWRDGRDSPGSAYAETLATEIDHGWSPLFALRTPVHHYVRAPRPELYALPGDAGQLHDLAARDRVAVAPALAQLDAELERVVARERSLRAGPIDAQTREKLAALGYAIPEAPVARSGLDPKDGLRFLGGYFEALRALHAGDLAHARDLLVETLAKLPTSAAAHGLLAQVERLGGRGPTALEHAAEAVRLRPCAANLALLGDTKAQLGDRAGAEAAYRAAARVDADEPLAQIGLAWVALRSGDADEAELRAERAIALQPSSAEVRERVAGVLEEAGHYERALETYREAQRLDPASERIHVLLAIQLARLGRDAEADAHLLRGGAAADIPYLRNRLAIAYAARGETARAEAIFRDLVRRHPEYASARSNLATLLRGTGRTASDAARGGPPESAARTP